MAHQRVLEYAAFTDAGRGGNPAGVVLDADGLSPAAMVALAAGLGHSETAFVTRLGERRFGVRYFSPDAEVPFCGHATVATAAALASEEGLGGYEFATPVGPISLVTSADADGVRVEFTSAEPQVRGLDADVLASLLDALGLVASDLDPRYPPRQAWAGNWHPIVVLSDRTRFDGFTFDPGVVRGLMDAHGWTGTVTVLFADGPGRWEARNLFPAGAITEDPATGSAAASTGGYLRELGASELPADLVIRQGRHVGRPSVLHVRVPVAGGIVVSGVAGPLGGVR